tara:strand:- start:467 stop:1351 length:885 start_codon:yes stop_codon:yes gene_type:complete
MSLSSIVSRIIPTATAYVTSGFNPVVAAAAAYGTESSKRQAERAKDNIIRENERRQQSMMDFYTPNSSIPTIKSNLAATTPRISVDNSGGGLLDTIRGGLKEVGGFVQDAFSSGIPQLLGLSRPQGVSQQPALTTVTNVGARESQSSGTIQAGIGGALGPLLQAGRSLLKSPGGQLAIGTGAGLATGMFSGKNTSVRVTRKMKRDAKMVLNMTGGNLAAAADMFGVSQDFFIFVLLKRFRNDGPVVTKAALRKTKQTIRRLHSMQDVLKSITPTAAGRRRAPMKRATTTTLIKN